MQCIFRWSIENFSCYLALKRCGDTIFSPVFKSDDSAGAKWYMSLFPKGELNYEGYVSIHLTRLLSAESDLCNTKLQCKISIMDADSRVWRYKEVDQGFEELNYIRFNNFVEIERISEEEASVLPGDILTIDCQICAYSERDLELRSRMEVAISQNELKKLSDDLKMLFASGRFSDVTLMVKDANIPSHKAILCARSPVFEELIRYSASNDYINIPDFEKSTMDALLTFMYSGQIDVKVALSSLALYDAAKRYCIQDLTFSLAPRTIFTVTEAVMKRYTFTWRLSNFSTVKERCGRIVYSDKFNTESPSSAWNLSLHFHEEPADEDESIGIYLNKMWSAIEQRSVFVRFNLHLVDKKQHRRYVMHLQSCFWPTSRHGFPLFINTSRLLQERNELLPSDILTVRCEVTEYNGKYVSSTRRSYYSPNSNLLQISYARNVSESLKELLSNQMSSDLTVRSTGRSFFLHRAILCARSTAFAELLQNVDNNSNSYTIAILDIRPSILEMLFTFIYTGVMVDLEEDTAPGLYKAACRYNIGNLKDICSGFLRSNITLNNACETFVLSHASRDPVLQHVVKDFMCTHADELVLSRQWHDFMKEYPRLANEILACLSKEYCESKRRRYV